MPAKKKSPRNKTTQEIADLLDVDTSTVNRWVTEGLPCDKPKSSKQSALFDEAEVAAWMQKNGRTGKVGRPQEPGTDKLTSLKIQKEAALVARYERENAEAEGRLIDAAQEKIRDIQKITTLRNRLQGLGARLAPQLQSKDAEEIQTSIDDTIEELLQEFARE